MLNEDVQKLLAILPQDMSDAILEKDINSLTELVIDLGKFFEYRIKNFLTVQTDLIISQFHINYILGKIPPIGQDGRVGIDGTLHRISVIWDKNNKVVGYTMRLGKPFIGNIDLYRDLLLDNSILIIGKPGLGKTSSLRLISEYLSETKRVVVVDKSSEIGGEAIPAHDALGAARRIQVPYKINQADIMIYAVENTSPQTIICDEISTYLEAEAARTISNRGVQLIATAHGKGLEDIIKNPPLCNLIGGINVSTLSDETTKLKGLTSKTILERKTEPIFNVIIEILSFNEVAIHVDVAKAVDSYLSGDTYAPLERRNYDGKIISIPSVSKSKDEVNIRSSRKK